MKKQELNDLRHVMQDNYLSYASYVILERAIPHLFDGLKPVQRRVLYVLYKIDDGKLHKVANVSGQTMAFHPHGDVPIMEALVNMANRGYLLDKQGNFGNLHTGDPAAAARYIETRLSPLARETLFNPDLTTYLPSYDSRNEEPSVLPAKIPVLLLQGAEGIAVGMSTRILPHNFNEVLEAEIQILQDKPFTLVPDFPTGGMMDASQYDKGRGRIKLRAKLVIRDPKTIVIEEICYGTTTESVTRSIDEAAKKGKIKIDSIHDYTSDKVEVEIKLPRGQYAEQLIEELYAFTECEVVLHTQFLVIKDNLPWEGDVDSALREHAQLLQGYLRRELEIERERILQKVFEKTLEQIFIDNRLYKKIEEVKTYEKIHETIELSLKPFHKQLQRVPVFEDREKLLGIPIRRISRFDVDKNVTEISALLETLKRVEKDLQQIKQYTIRYLQALIKKYGKQFPRLTKIQEIQEVDRRSVETRQIKVGVDLEKGFLGTQVHGGKTIECTNFDKLLLFYEDGVYNVVPIPEKQYIHRETGKMIYVGVADKKTVFSVVYRDLQTHYCYAKRFIVDKFILGKEYRYLDQGAQLEHLTTNLHSKVELSFKPQHRQKVSLQKVDLSAILVKGVSAKGIRLANKAVQKITITSSSQKKEEPVVK